MMSQRRDWTEKLWDLNKHPEVLRHEFLGLEAIHHEIHPTETESAFMNESCGTKHYVIPFPTDRIRKKAAAAETWEASYRK